MSTINSGSSLILPSNKWYNRFFRVHVHTHADIHILQCYRTNSCIITQFNSLYIYGLLAGKWCWDKVWENFPRHVWFLKRMWWRDGSESGFHGVYEFLECSYHVVGWKKMTWERVRCVESWGEEGCYGSLFMMVARHGIICLSIFVQRDSLTLTWENVMENLHEAKMVEVGWWWTRKKGEVKAPLDGDHSSALFSWQNTVAFLL